MPTLCFVECIKCSLSFYAVTNNCYNTSRAVYNAPGANALTGNETKLPEVRVYSTACAKCLGADN